MTRSICISSNIPQSLVEKATGSGNASRRDAQNHRMLGSHVVFLASKHRLNGTKFQYWMNAEITLFNDVL